jgi:hypothetical protein
MQRIFAGALALHLLTPDLCQAATITSALVPGSKVYVG